MSLAQMSKLRVLLRKNSSPDVVAVLDAWNAFADCLTSERSAIEGPDGYVGYWNTVVESNFIPQVIELIPPTIRVEYAVSACISPSPEWLILFSRQVLHRVPL